jgi:hypothetical protein
VQGYRIELAPTPEQRVRLAQHAGPARVAENFYLEKSGRRPPARGRPLICLLQNLLAL